MAKKDQKKPAQNEKKPQKKPQKKTNPSGHLRRRRPLSRRMVVVTT